MGGRINFINELTNVRHEDRSGPGGLWSAEWPPVCVWDGGISLAPYGGPCCPLPTPVAPPHRSMSRIQLGLCRAVCGNGLHLPIPEDSLMTGCPCLAHWVQVGMGGWQTLCGTGCCCRHTAPFSFGGGAVGLGTRSASAAVPGDTRVCGPFLSVGV